MMKRKINRKLKNFLFNSKMLWFLVALLVTVLSSLVTYLIVSSSYKNIESKIALIKTNHNFPLLVNVEDKYEGELLIKYGVYKEHIARLIPRLVKNGDICLDIGAGYGYHSVLMSQLVGERGKVISYEFIPEIFELLKYNVLINQSINVQSYNNILYSQPIEGFMEISKENLTISAFLVPTKKYQSKNSHLKSVIADKLDILLPDLRNVTLINVRTNGSELAVIKGAKDIISRSPNLSIIVPWSSSKFLKYGEGYMKLIDSFINAKFEFWLIKPDSSLKLIQKDQLLKLERVDVLISRRDIG